MLAGTESVMLVEKGARMFEEIASLNTGQEESLTSPVLLVHTCDTVSPEDHRYLDGPTSSWC